MRRDYIQLKYRTAQRARRFLTTAGRIYVLLAVFSLALCLVWVTDAVIRGMQDAKIRARMTELQAIRASAVPDGQGAVLTVAMQPFPVMTPMANPEPSVLPGLATLYEQNLDLAGWLSIEGTVIDYPVMFRPDDRDYYLTHNFDRRKDKNGALFIQADCDPFQPGGNTIIHGHNIKSGNMFGDLNKYKDETYFREHPVIRFDTLYERGEYRIVAVFLSQVYRKNDSVFKYYQFLQADTEAEFDDFVSNIKALALYKTGVDAKYGDTFITLSTCSYHTENGRLVVVARKAGG